MKDHSELPLRENPDHFILHVGTSDLNSDRDPKRVAKSIMGVSLLMEKEKGNRDILNIILINVALKEKAT